MDTLPLVNGVKVSPYDSPEQVLAKIAEHARTHPYQNPLLGSGFLAPAFGVAGPTAAQLDAIVPDRPALIIDEVGIPVGRIRSLWKRRGFRAIPPIRCQVRTFFSGTTRATQPVG